MLPMTQEQVLSDLIKDLSFWDVSQNSQCRQLVVTAAQQKLRSCLLTPTNDTPIQTTWKSAVDPNTGATYYYDVVTRKTQWKKPQQLKDFDEQQKRIQQRKDMEFFAIMEQNIMDSIHRGEIVPGVTKPTKLGAPLDPLPPLPTLRVRTISSMNESVLMDLQQPHSQTSPATKSLTVTTLADDGSHSSHRLTPREGRPPLPNSTRNRSTTTLLDEMTGSSLEVIDKPVKQDRLQGGALGLGVKSSTSMQQAAQNGSLKRENNIISLPHEYKPELLNKGNKPAPMHTRRNTGGTIHVQNTMENPDINATIRCVCGVYRAHIEQSAKQPHTPARPPLLVDLTLFQDDSPMKVVPTLEQIENFYQDFFRRSQMEHDTIIMSLIYVERLVKMTHGALVPTGANWRSVLFSCMILASKVWDDLSMWNIDFSKVSAASSSMSKFTLRRINELEIAVLQCLNFDVKVPASEYAKYYFLLRSMLIRSGMLPEAANPHGKDDRVESKTSHYQDTISSVARANRRTRSADWGQPHAGKQFLPDGPVLKEVLCLEQIVSNI